MAGDPGGAIASQPVSEPSAFPVTQAAPTPFPAHVAVLLAGAALWLVHSVLMIVAVVGVFALAFGGNFGFLGAVFGTIIAGMVILLVAAILVGVGFILAGSRRVFWAPGDLTTAGALFIVYGILGVVALALDFTVVGPFITWVVGAVLLLVAAGKVAPFLRQYGTTGLKAYAGVNLAGAITFIAAGVLLIMALAALSLGLLLVAGIAFLVGAIIQFLVLPIMGIVVFSLVIVAVLRMRGAPVVAFPPTIPGVPTAMPGAPYGYPYPSPASMAGPTPQAYQGYQGYQAYQGYPPVPGMPPMTPPQPYPPSAVPTPIGTAPVNPPAPATWADGGSDASNLEEQVREHRSFLLKLDSSLVEGRIDNATYSEMKRVRTERISELERQIAERRGDTSPPQTESTQPGP